MAIEPLSAPPPVEQEPAPDIASSLPPSEPSRRSRRRAGRRAERLRARQVVRVVRRVEPWSVLKVAMASYLCLWLVFTVAGTLLWQLARVTGTLDNLQDFLATALADESFTIEGGRVLVASLLGGVVLVFAGSGLTVLLAVLFNQVSELTGGVRISVVELETAAPAAEDGSQIAHPVR